MEPLVIQKVEKGSDLSVKLLDFVQNFSWLEVQEHTVKTIQNWNFEEWETPFVALCGDRIVAMATIMKSDYYPLPEVYPWISTLFVSETYRGKGICGQLIAHANHYAAVLGFQRTYIPTEHIGLYEKYGYRYVKNIVNYGGGIDRLYAKEITSL